MVLRDASASKKKSPEINLAATIASDQCDYSLLVEEELVHVGYAEEREDLFIIGTCLVLCECVPVSVCLFCTENICL